MPGNCGAHWVRLVPEVHTILRFGLCTAMPNAIRWTLVALRFRGFDWVGCLYLCARQIKRELAKEQIHGIVFPGTDLCNVNDWLENSQRNNSVQWTRHWVSLPKSETQKWKIKRWGKMIPVDSSFTLFFRWKVLNHSINTVYAIY